MNDSLFAAGQPITYQRYTNNEFVPARVLGPSTRGEQYIHIVYERNGHEQEPAGGKCAIMLGGLRLGYACNLCSAVRATR